MSHDLLARYAKLPPRTREIIRVATSRPELRLTDVATVIGMATSTLRFRLRVAYRKLDVEGRVELQARLGPLLEDAAEEA